MVETGDIISNFRKATGAFKGAVQGKDKVEAKQAKHDEDNTQTEVDEDLQNVFHAQNETIARSQVKKMTEAANKYVDYHFNRGSKSTKGTANTVADAKAAAKNPA